MRLFFFQAEDGIRDVAVTGVQTCALPIYLKSVDDLTTHYSTAPLYVSASGEIGEVQGAVVSSGYFPMLGLRPYLGRFFTLDEDSVPDRDAVAVIGYGFWRRIYSGDSHVIGKTFLINGRSFTVVGIMPTTVKLRPLIRKVLPMTRSEEHTSELQSRLHLV